MADDVVIITVRFDGKAVRVLRSERFAGGPHYCVEGYSHWNPASFFRDHASDLMRKSRLFDSAANHIEGKA